MDKRIVGLSCALSLVVAVALGYSQRAYSGPSACGNSLVESGEECDDGNTVAGDGCNAACFIEGPLSKLQQRCIIGSNSAFTQTITAANKAGVRCVRRIAKGTMIASWPQCTSIVDFSLSAARGTSMDARRCVAKGIAAASTFAYTGDPTGMQNAAVNETISAHGALLGNPAAIALAFSAKPQALCQRTVVRGFGKYLKALAKHTQKAKKRSLKDLLAPAATSLELEADLVTVPNTPKVLKALNILKNKAAKNCVGQDLAVLFPGTCQGSATSTVALADCAAQVGRCHYCLALNAADQLEIDCLAYSGLGVCESAVCGNGTAEGGEACDDGNTASGDGCDASCALEQCGDGVVQPGEDCDDSNTLDGDGCDASCAFELCGDGTVQAGEDCDDGNTLDGDGCDASCNSEGVCGDGVLESSEGCDDANTVGGDGCSATCQIEVVSCPLTTTPPVELGGAGSFAVLAKSGVSITGAGGVVGDIGVSPAFDTSLTGFGQVLDGSGEFSTSALVVGRLYAADYTPPTPGLLTTAVSNMETAYTDAAGRAPDVTGLGAGDIGGLSLPSGVYRWATGLLIPTDVTLTGGPTEVWIFQVSGTLTVSPGAKVLLSGGALASNIVWQVAGQVTLDTTSEFKGTILGQTGIAMNPGAILDGRALAQTAVTLSSNTVTEAVALGSCWTLGTAGGSCTTACSDRGLAYDDATRTVAGSAGTLARCEDVADELIAHGPASDIPTCSAGLGCGLDALADVVRCLDPVTDAGGSDAAIERFCACTPL